MHMEVGEYVSMDKSRKCATARRKNDHPRLSFGPSTKHDPKGVYLTSDELAYWDGRFALSDKESIDIERTVGSLMSHKPLISTDALEGRNPLVNIQTGSNTHSEGCSGQAGSHLSRWVHWQTAPIPTKVIDHSSSSNTLRSVLEFIDHIQMNPDLSLTYDSEMRVFLNKDDVRYESDKVLRRKQNRRIFLDDDEDEDFKMPDKKRVRETVQTELIMTSSDNKSHPSSPHPEISHLVDREFRGPSSSQELDCNEVHTTMPLVSQSVVPLPPNMESIDWLDEITSSQISTQSFAPISSTNTATLKISSSITPITASISAISSSVTPNTASLSTNSTISSSTVTPNTVSLGTNSTISSSSITPNAVSLNTNSTLSSSSQNTSSPSHQRKGSFKKPHYSKDFQFATPKQPLSAKRKLQLLNEKTIVHNCPSVVSNSCSIVSNTSLNDIPSAILFGDEEEEEEMLNPFVILESPEKKAETVNLSEYNNRQNCTTPEIPKPVIKTSYQISTIEQDNENIQQTSKSCLTFTPRRKMSLVIRPPECPTSNTPSLIDHSTESLALSPAPLPLNRTYTHSTPSHTLTSPTSKISRHISETPDSEEKFLNKRIVQRRKRSFKQPDFLCSQMHSTRKEESPELEIMEEGMGLSLSDETVMEEGMGLGLCVNKDIVKQSSPISPGLKHNEDACKYRQRDALVPVNGSSVFNKRNLERMKNRKYALESDNDDFIKPVKKRLMITATSNTTHRTPPLASMKEEGKEFDFVEEEADISRDYWSDDEREESTGYEYDYSDSFINDNSILTQGVSPTITKNGRASKPSKSPLNIGDVYRKSLRSPDNLFDGKRTGFGNQYKLVFSQRYKLLNHYSKKAGLKISSSAKRPYGKQRVRDLRKEVEDSLIESEAEEVNKFIDDSESPVSQEELNVLKDEEMLIFPEEVSDEDIELIEEKDIVRKKTRRAYLLSDSEGVEDNSIVITSSSYQEKTDKSPERREMISLDTSDEEMDEDKEEDELGVFDDEREEIDEWNLREDNEAVCSEEQCMMIAVLVREGVIVSPSLKVSI